MKTKQWIFIVLLSMLAMACSDQTRQTHTIAGKVFFEGTMEPMDDILLNVYQDNGQGGLQGNVIGSNQLTGADGSFLFELRPFKNGEASNIILTANAISQIQLGFSQQSFSLPIVFEEIDPVLVMEDDTYTQDIIGRQFGFLEIEFRGNTDLFFGDEVAVEIRGDDYAYRTQMGPGDELDQKFRYPVKAGTSTKVIWTAKISGIEETGVDSLICRNRVATSFWIEI